MSENAYRLVERLSCREPLPDDCVGPIRDADDLLHALVHGSDGKGRFYADVRLIRARFWWQWESLSDTKLRRWLDELIERRDVVVAPIGRSCYSPEPVDILTIQHRQRFARFKPRAPIPADLRATVYERDGYRCVSCGSDEDLSLDHVHPWSLGGEDTFDNLQTMCRPCNSRKGARV